jgi:hypothetical protein
MPTLMLYPCGGPLFVDLDFCSHLLAVSYFLLLQSAGGIGSLTFARAKVRRTHQAFEIFFQIYKVYAGCVLLSAIIIASNLDIRYTVIFVNTSTGNRPYKTDSPAPDHGLDVFLRMVVQGDPGAHQVATHSMSLRGFYHGTLLDFATKTSLIAPTALAAGLISGFPVDIGGGVSSSFYRRVWSVGSMPGFLCTIPSSDRFSYELSLSTSHPHVQICLPLFTSTWRCVKCGAGIASHLLPATRRAKLSVARGFGNVVAESISSVFCGFIRRIDYHMCQYIDKHAIPGPITRTDMSTFEVFLSDWRSNLVDVSTLPDDDPVVFHPGRASVRGLGLYYHLRRWNVPPAGPSPCSTHAFSSLATNVQSDEYCWRFCSGCALLHAPIASVIFAFFVWRPACLLDGICGIPVSVKPFLLVAPVIIPTDASTPSCLSVGSHDLFYTLGIHGSCDDLFVVYADLSHYTGHPCATMGATFPATDGYTFFLFLSTFSGFSNAVDTRA